MVYIYALIDPNTKEIRYIGKTNDPHRRQKERNSRIGKRKNHCYNWLAKLNRFGQKAKFIIIQKVPKSCWKEAERYWIEYFDNKGCPLTNITPGGEGVGSGEDHPLYGLTRTEEFKTYISRKQKEAWRNNDKRREEQSKRAKKLWRDPEYKEKMREKMLGNTLGAKNKISEEHRRILRRSMLEPKEYHCDNCGKDFKNRASFGGHRAHCVGDATEKIKKYYQKHTTSEHQRRAASIHMTKKQKKTCPDCQTVWNTHAAYAAHRSHCKKNKG